MFAKFGERIYLTGQSNTTLNIKATTKSVEKLFYPVSSTRKLSWALEGNFLAWRLQGQISRFGPAARNDYFRLWDSFTNPSLPGLVGKQQSNRRAAGGRQKEWGLHGGLVKGM